MLPVSMNRATDPLILNVVQSDEERQPAWLPDAVWQPIDRSAERSPPPVRGELAVSVRPVPTTEELFGDSDSVIVLWRATWRAPLIAAPLVRTWRPVPTTAVDTGDSAIGS